MNTKEKTLTGLVGVLSFAAVAPFAFGAVGSDTQTPDAQDYMRGHGPRVELSEEVRDEMKEAFESGDYNAYTTLAREYELPKVMTEEQFNNHLAQHENRESMHEAVLAGDYDAFRELMGDKAPQITEENFDLLVAMAEARESGDEDAIDSARDALKDAGIGRPMMGKARGEAKGGEHGMRPDFASMTDEEKQNLKDRFENRGRGYKH